MSNNSLQVGDTGTRLEVTIKEAEHGLQDPVDISTASVMKIILRKPDGTVVEKTAQIATDGYDGKMFATTVAADVDIAGAYEIQGYVEVGSWKGHSTIGKFDAEENLGA